MLIQVFLKPLAQKNKSSTDLCPKGYYWQRAILSNDELCEKTP